MFLITYKDGQQVGTMAESLPEALTVAYQARRDGAKMLRSVTEVAKDTTLEVSLENSGDTTGPVVWLELTQGAAADAVWPGSPPPVKVLQDNDLPPDGNVAP